MQFTKSNFFYQLRLVGTKMVLTKVFIDQFTYWAAGINAIYLFS